MIQHLEARHPFADIDLRCQLRLANDSALSCRTRQFDLYLSTSESRLLYVFALFHPYLGPIQVTLKIASSLGEDVVTGRPL
jgi:hypothetical protein